MLDRESEWCLACWTCTSLMGWAVLCMWCGGVHDSVLQALENWCTLVMLFTGAALQTFTVMLLTFWYCFLFVCKVIFFLFWILSQHYLNIRIVLLEKPCLHSSKFFSTHHNLWSPSQLIWCYVIFVLDIEMFNNIRFDQLHGRSAVVALTAILSTTAVMACPSRCRLSMW